MPLWTRDTVPRTLVLALTLAVPACVSVPVPGLLRVRTVPWNPASAPVGRVVHVGERAHATVVVADQGTWELAGGAAGAHDPPTPGAHGLYTLPAATGNGTWLVTLGLHGEVLRVNPGHAPEDLSGRYGLDGVPVQAVAGDDRHTAGFLLDDAVALSDGQTVTTVACPGCTALVGGGGRIAARAGETVRVFDPARHWRVDYRVTDARWIALDGSGTLAVASPTGVWVETTPEHLRRMVSTGNGQAVHGLAASTHRVWFAVGTELGTVEAGSVRITRGAGVPMDASLTAARRDGVWTLARGALARIAVADTTTTGGPDWGAALGGVYSRSCARCHGADGSAGLDLSTPDGWSGARTAVAARVLAARDMPPPGNPLSDDDRRVVQAWVQSATSVAQSP